MPRPEPYWIALGIVVAAIAISQGPKRRRLFLRALRELTEQHESRTRVVSFDTRRNHTRALSHSIKGSAAWMYRLIEELETAPEP